MAVKPQVRKYELVAIDETGVTEKAVWLVLRPFGRGEWVASIHDSFEAALAHVDHTAFLDRLEPPC